MRPEIPYYLLGTWRAFNDLGSERQVGAAGIGWIPRSKIAAYVADEMGLDGDDADYMRDVLLAVDTAYVTMSNSTDKTPPTDAVPVTDIGGVKRLFQRLGRRQDIKRKRAER